MKRLAFKPFLLLSLLLFFVAGLSKADACDWCNNQFFIELNTTRSGTLVADELLRAINGQRDFETLAASSRLNERADKKAEEPAAETAEEATPAPPPPPSTLLEAVPSTGASSVPGAVAPSNVVTYDPDHPFIDIINRDNSLNLPATSYVPQDSDVEPDVRISITLQEGEVYLGNGVMYSGFTVDGGIPGPTFTMQEGDIVEFTVVNNGKIPHGASIHAAYTQTSKYLGQIPAGQSRTMLFQVNTPGVYLYHCAPGGHAIPMHIIYGQYGMMVVEPKQKFKLEEELGRGPDIEINISQHEYYANGKDAVTGQGNPMYTAFNGKLFRYVEEPIMAKPGDYVRINFLNIGPNLVSTFHLVGIIWDYAYWQGNPENVFVGGQSVIAGPSDSWTIEFRVPPDEGAYTMLSHAVGSTDRGAIGLLVADNDADRTTEGIDGQGPIYTEDEMAEFKAKSRRMISPFAPGTEDVDVPMVYGKDTEEVIVRIIGNSYYPKIIDVKPGTKVTWINEDVFTYMQGEFSGLHNAVGIKGPERFASPLLTHAESFTKIFTEEGEYEYMCTPHPYMRGIVRVSPVESEGFMATAGFGITSMLIALLAICVAVIAVVRTPKQA